MPIHSNRVTVKKALEKYCPLSLANPNALRRHCLGDQCMVWMWAYPNGEEVATESIGYCGLRKEE